MMAEHPLYWELKRYDHTGSIRCKGWGPRRAEKQLFERGFIMKSLRYPKSYQITDKGRGVLKSGDT